MRKMIAALSAFALAVPVVVPMQAAEAQTRTYKGKSHRYYRHAPRRCRHSPGTTGLIAGGVAGAVAGPAIVGGGLLGSVVGAGAGALGGRALDRTLTAKRRCR
jgi:hypothetical protein